MRRIIFIIGAILALGSGIGIYLQIDYSKGLIPVVFAASDISEDTVVYDQQLIIKKVPRESVPDSVATNKNQVIGKALNWPLKEGDPVRVDKIEQNPKASANNTRLIAFKTDYDGSIAGLVRYGQTVDLVISVDPKVSGSTSMTGYILTDLFVEATADSTGNILTSADTPYIPSKAGSAVSLSNGNQTKGIPVEIIAKVTPRQFLVIKQAETMGTLSLGKRSKDSVNLYNINQVVEDSNVNVSKDFILALLAMQK
ncbi:MAG: SAF domain-containing protein [Candidatus Dehalobacter alkaniphilus]